MGFFARVVIMDGESGEWVVGQGMGRLNECNERKGFKVLCARGRPSWLAYMASGGSDTGSRRVI